METPESQSASGHRRAEVARLSELSRDLKQQIDEIEQRIAELKADIASRPSGVQKPDSDSGGAA